MIFLLFLIIIYSIAYLAVYILAHKNATMIRPLTTMTFIMLMLLLATAVISLALGRWYISLIILFIFIGLLQFLFYLSKY